MRKIEILVVSLMVVASILFVPQNMWQLKASPVQNGPSYVPGNPLRVNGTLELAAKSSSGDGSALSPYNITGWDIDGTGFGYCIYIGNTTANFSIHGNFLHNASGVVNHPWYANSGVILYNCSYGNVTDNIIRENDVYGIYLWNVNSTMIYANYLYNNTLRGISICNWSTANIIQSNTVNGMDPYTHMVNSNVGVAFYDLAFDNYCAHNAITMNLIGIGMQLVNHTTLYHNTIMACDLGIGCINVGNTTAEANTISVGDFGITYLGCQDDRTLENIIFMEGIGIYYSGCTRDTTHDNDIDNTMSNGMTLHNGWSNIYYLNDIGNCGEFGIEILNYTCPGWSNETIYNNTLHDNVNQSYDPSTHAWWNTSTGYGNFWDNWTTPDVDNNGFVEAYFYMTSNNDSYPQCPIIVYPPAGTPPGGGGSGSSDDLPPVDNDTGIIEGGDMFDFDIHFTWLFWPGIVMVLIGLSKFPIPYLGMIRPKMWLALGAVAVFMSFLI